MGHPTYSELEYIKTEHNKTFVPQSDSNYIYVQAGKTPTSNGSETQWLYNYIVYKVAPIDSEKTDINAENISTGDYIRGKELSREYTKDYIPQNTDYREYVVIGSDYAYTGTGGKFIYNYIEYERTSRI